MTLLWVEVAEKNVGTPGTVEGVTEVAGHTTSGVCGADGPDFEGVWGAVGEPGYGLGKDIADVGPGAAVRNIAVLIAGDGLASKTWRVRTM